MPYLTDLTTTENIEDDSYFLLRYDGDDYKISGADLKSYIQDSTTTAGTSALMGGYTTYELINSASAATALADVDFIQTSGYTSANDGGSGFWYKSGDTGTASQTVFDLYELSVTDTSGNIWEYVIVDTVNPLALGVILGSSADDQASNIETILTAVSVQGGGVIKFPSTAERTLVLTSRTKTQNISNVTVDFNELSIQAGVNGGLRITGEVVELPESDLPKLNTDIAAGATEITVAYTTEDFFSVGDTIHIRGENDSNGIAVINDNGDYYEERFITASSYDSGVYTLTLNSALDFAYTVTWPDSDYTTATGDTDYTFITKTKSSVLSTYTAGTQSFDLSSDSTSSYYSVGDIVMVGDSYKVGDIIPEDQYADDRYSDIYSRRWIFKVIDITGSTVTLSDPLPFDLEEDYYPRMTLLSMCDNTHIKNARVEFVDGDSSLNYHGIHLWLCSNSTVTNSYVTNHVGNAFRFEYCYECFERDNQAEYAKSYDGGEGYGVAIYGGTRVNSFNFYGNSLRHNNLFFKSAAHCLVSNARAIDTYGSCFDVHGANEYDITFYECSAYRGDHNSDDIDTVTPFKVGNPKHWGRPDNIRFVKCRANGAFDYGLSILPRTGYVYADITTNGVVNSVYIDKISTSKNFVDDTAWETYESLFRVEHLELARLTSTDRDTGSAFEVAGQNTDQSPEYQLEKLVVGSMNITRDNDYDDYFARFRYIDVVEINSLNMLGATSSSTNPVLYDTITTSCQVGSQFVESGHSGGRIANCPLINIASLSGVCRSSAAINSGGGNTQAHVHLNGYTATSDQPGVTSTVDVLITSAGRLMPYQDGVYYPIGTQIITDTGIATAKSTFTSSGDYDSSDWFVGPTRVETLYSGSSTGATLSLSTDWDIYDYLIFYVSDSDGTWTQHIQVDVNTMTDIANGISSSTYLYLPIGASSYWQIDTSTVTELTYVSSSDAIIYEVIGCSY